MLKKIFEKMWQEAYLKNTENIVACLSKNGEAIALDVGCGDGQKTAIFKRKIRCKEMVGIDGVLGRLTVAEKNGINKIITSNLETTWPFKENSFDVVISNQVIEHINDVDLFISEIYRILKPGGYAVISTENLASWHNIVSLILGYQDFSHHLLKKAHIGTPLSLHYKEKTVTWSKKDNSGVDDTAFPHIKIFTLRSLINAFTIYGFKLENKLGSGYYPISGTLSTIMSKFDPYHSHFICIKMRKLSK